MDFSEYIVYIDESGDHGLTNINPDHPVFALAFCVVEKAKYIEKVVPAIQRLKFDSGATTASSCTAMKFARQRAISTSCSMPRHGRHLSTA
ncbi:DUF3800 domain-containing protein [Bradyrhizobium iriomotense]|uniref:DUF3800 domain-containing protein n=1 Tax=Bradyrhizobium iriomotense TaxID=441950 RepID=A0ABQ6BBL4_9BRAD|nr:DUF3800 domain-containing protein [Bradyrhizobium iriomotense]GLR90886.1 hypothetical protein GCM10007857_76020 [Bradyrhizobium iriomotense]